MRINQFVAAATGLSRRAADIAITEKRVRINNSLATLGSQVAAQDEVSLDAARLTIPAPTTIALHKPKGYVTSRRQQGSTPTVYALLPPELNRLKPIGRLDQDSSGLLLLTDDGQLAQTLQHPSARKWKHYHVQLNKPLTSADLERLRQGVQLSDGVSHLQVQGAGSTFEVRMQEGRNRQIRRTFAALSREVIVLHRLAFGPVELGELGPGRWRPVESELA